MESNIEPVTTDPFDPFDLAIIRALRKYPEGIRNIKLNKESKINGKNLNVKTFNQHLKWLVKSGVVDRNEEGRARVFYKLHPREAEKEERKGWSESRVKDLASLYEHRKEFDEDQVAEKFFKIIHSTFAPIRRLFYFAIHDLHNPIDFGLDVNRAMEFFRESAIEVGKLVEKNDETFAFFDPLLAKGGAYGWI